ncbi:MAG: hypothetical protein KC502_14830 [Myxococcales bacterium]|nr:hypothetical protein [Myxococcales bacterium]
MTKCAIHTCTKDVCAGAANDTCMPACMTSRCMGLAALCHVAPAATGSGGCKDILACVPKCAGSLSCLQKCVASARWAGQLAYAELWACMATSTSKDPQADCYFKALACGAEGQASDDDCYDLLQCSGACAAGLSTSEFDCNVACYGRGTPEARSQFDEVVNCYSGFAEGKEPSVCTATLGTCIAPAGKLSCGEIEPCRAACQKTGNTADVCTFSCLRQANPSEAKLYLDWTLCMSVSCANECAGSTDDDCLPNCHVSRCGKAKMTCQLGG